MNNNTENEIWKDIKGYEGLYRISNTGKVYSVRNNKLFVSCTCGAGYQKVVLSDNGVYKNHLIHRLVATHFLENPQNLPMVNHIDENKKNNHVNNLEWCSHKYNMNHGTRTERAAKKLRKKIRGTSIDEQEVIELDSITDGEKNGFSRLGITACLKGRNKTHKGYTWEYVK